jgi:hypothetical protein
MRITLIATLFLLPISAVAAKPLHNLLPTTAGHHPLGPLYNVAPRGAAHNPVTGKKMYPGLDVHQMHKNANIHKMPAQHFNDKSLVFDRKH